MIASSSTCREQNWRWKRESSGVDLTYLRDSPLDVVGMAVHFSGHPEYSNLLGDFQLTGSLFRGSGKLLGITGPLMWNRYLWGRCRRFAHSNWST